MSQSEIFRTAIAAKLKGDDAAFTAAIKEAIKEKAKEVLGEVRQPVTESAQHKGPGVEEVDRNWYYVHEPFQIPEGNVAGLPAGPYTASLNIGLHPRFGDSPVVLEVEICHPGDDQVLKAITGNEAESFYDYIPEATRNWINSKVADGMEVDAERQHNDSQADMGYERQQAARTNMDGKDYPF